MNFDAILPSIQDKLPKDPMALITLREKFEKLDESKKQAVVTQIPLLNLKSPAFVFWVGNFLFGTFGVARFMIGDKVLGFVRLGITILVIILSIMVSLSASLYDLGAAKFFYNLSNLVVVVNSIWWFVDLFLVGKKLRRKNLEKIMQILY